MYTETFKEVVSITHRDYKVDVNYTYLFYFILIFSG
ncbi:hypothetical protein BN2127_JRS1_02672 [Bacillus cereus]|nr:hypothetical protein BN2127_JRS1_02672 [Bacillus cereus]